VLERAAKVVIFLPGSHTRNANPIWSNRRPTIR
jgi:hypothetical protein